MPSLYCIPEEIAESWASRVKIPGCEVLREPVSDEDAEKGMFSKGVVVRGKERVQIFILAPSPNPPELTRIGKIHPLTGKYVALLRNQLVGRWPWRSLGRTLFPEVDGLFQEWALPIEPDSTENPGRTA